MTGIVVITLIAPEGKKITLDAPLTREQFEALGKSATRLADGSLVVESTEATVIVPVSNIALIEFH